MGEISKRVRNNDGRMNLPLLTISARYGWMTQQSRFSASIAGREKKNYTLLKKHQLSYNHGNSKVAIYGTVYELTDYDEALVPKVYHSFSLTSENSSKFIESYFHTKKLDAQLRKFIASTARMDGLLNISFDDFMKVKLFAPEQCEQSKISRIINLIEKLITLQQRKLEQLKLLEKALQQKLFPNNFQEKPLLRILNGDNSWWNSYIGEVFTERVDKGNSKKLLSVSITNGVYPFDESKRKNNSSNDKHNYKKVFQNDIAYNSMRLWQGALGVSNYEGIVSPAYTVLKPLANQNSIFYEFMFKNIDMLHIFQRNSQGLTSDTWNLKFNQLQHIKIKTTNLNSQNKIAKLLIKIEKLKNNESNYYHNLMTLKKYLLQKLFI
ncbi:restriction endonuclease subunit S [Limosilactobacillus agrestis]|uniref:restriction endonuclease subunit S n=1 Tax=Limosilactobacillus agrestis TaxID=2759748 RepID=UPI001E5EA3C4|nr:restriction endonuclease subunit S [Limosilactobacillus agrestis]MCD7120218.1 restriction endonuclease subunit S [Limosilactobacillus agrestis]